MTAQRNIGAVLLGLAVAIVRPVASAPAHEAERDTRHVAAAHEALEGLEHGIAALRSLGHAEEARRLERIAEDLRRRIAAPAPPGAREHRERAARQIEALRLALPALREREKRDAIELVERAIHARELALSEPGGVGAQQALRRGPGREDLIRILAMAEEIYRGFGNDERADALSRLTEESFAAPLGQDDAARDQIAVMMLAVQALREANRPDAAELMERAIHARAARAGGDHGPHAAAEAARAPDLPAQIELLSLAAGLWREYGQPEHAEKVAALAHQMGRRWEASRREEGDRPPQRLEEIARHLEELHGALERLRREVEALRDGRR
jgi:hypothetical protein